MPKKNSINPQEFYDKWITENLHHSNKSLFKYHYLNPKPINKYIPMPPPNITGKLHMGHALFLTIQDSLNRYYKNLGYNSLWLPGLDHAGLATYDKIQDYQKEMGLSYEEASRELPAKNKNIILEQITQLGALPQWDYLSYTLDKEYEEFTLKILKLLHKQNRITYEKGQYFLDIADYAHLLDQDIESGTFNIIPKYEIKNLSPFLKNLEKWNISRQIPWGTRLPFKQDGSNILFEECGSSDSLDTWFNSSLWPLASLIKNPQLIKDFYPATLIETGSDILFFWCARMLMMSHFIFDNQKELGLDISEPYAFKTIYLHGLIRDKNGEKFSKSLGNGIDPLDMIKKYGADSTRLFIISRSGPSEDIIFNEDLLPAQTKFINKIYQSARFFSIQSQKFELEKLNNQELIAPNKQLEQHQLHYGLLMDNYNFLEASRYIQSIYKQWFCDEWIEQNKQQIWDGNKETIYQGILILNQLLAMLDPFSPYISYQLHNEFFNK